MKNRNLQSNSTKKEKRGMHEVKKQTSQKKPTSHTKQLAMDAVFTVILVILGMIKLPSVIPGAEFQLSAPYAVCLASMVGFKRYLGIGICASLIQLCMGTHTIYNVLIAMVFRIVAGLIIELCPFKRLSLVISGPLGTACGRVVMSLVLEVPMLPLLAAALPGMVFTAVTVLILDRAVKKIPISWRNVG